MRAPRVRPKNESPAFPHRACAGDAALSVGVQAPGEQTLLRVQSVLSFVEHHRLRAVNDLVGDFLAAVRRQAMHEQRVGLGLRHQAGIDLVSLKDIVSVPAVTIAHRHPSIGDHAVGIFDRSFRDRRQS